MKIAISEALEEFSKHSGNELREVRVSLKQHFDGEQKLVWNIYGYKNGNNEWSDDSASFEEALANWEKKVEKKSSGNFVEV